MERALHVLHVTHVTSEGAWVVMRRGRGEGKRRERGRQRRQRPPTDSGMPSSSSSSSSSSSCMHAHDTERYRIGGTGWGYGWAAQIGFGGGAHNPPQIPHPLSVPRALFCVTGSGDEQRSAEGGLGRLTRAGGAGTGGAVLVQAVQVVGVIWGYVCGRWDSRGGRE